MEVLKGIFIASWMMLNHMDVVKLPRSYRLSLIKSHHPFFSSKIPFEIIYTTFAAPGTLIPRSLRKKG